MNRQSLLLQRERLARREARLHTRLLDVRDQLDEIAGQLDLLVSRPPFLSKREFIAQHNVVPLSLRRRRVLPPLGRSDEPGDPAA